MNRNEAKKQTEEHWERMIAWVETQDPDGVVSTHKMMVEIGEKWGALDCPLCIKYLRRDCQGCPLFVAFGRCASPSSENRYLTVARSKTWGEWLNNAGDFLAQIKSLGVKK